MTQHKKLKHFQVDCFSLYTCILIQCISWFSACLNSVCVHVCLDSVYVLIRCVSWFSARLDSVRVSIRCASRFGACLDNVGSALLLYHLFNPRILCVKSEYQCLHLIFCVQNQMQWWMLLSLTRTALPIIPFVICFLSGRFVQIGAFLPTSV